MKCGEFDIRNKEYDKAFNTETYFSRLLIERTTNDLNKTDGKGLIIFDVGAHKGESAEFFHEIFKQAQVYSFEPNPETASILEQKNIENVRVYQLALSNLNGTHNFYVQDLSHLSSLNQINIDSKQSLGYAENEKHNEIDVTVVRGDDFCISNGVKKIDLLKIDVQANEVDTLIGFSKYISNVKVVFVEVSFYDFYKKRSNIKQIEEALPGFELYDIFEVSKNPKTLGTDWATLVYKNPFFVSN